MQANLLGGWSCPSSEGESDSGDDWSREVKLAKIRIEKLSGNFNPVDNEFGTAVGELARLIGRDKAADYALDMLKNRIVDKELQIERAGRGVKRTKSKGGKQGQHRKMRYV